MRVLSESGWHSDYVSASHSEHSLASGDDVTVDGLIFKGQ